MQTFNSNHGDFNAGNNMNDNARSITVESPEPTPSTPLLTDDRPMINTIQNSQTQSNPERVTYAMLDHTNRRRNISDDNLDFRLQVPNSPLSSIPPTAFDSPTQGRSRRPISPETDF